MRHYTSTTYTLDNVNQIIAAAGIYADVFELLAFTGLRIGEAKWLTWNDIEIDDDSAGGTLHVRAKPGEWRPKDGDDRAIPLHLRVVRMLARRRRKYRFVFTAGPSLAYWHGGHQIAERNVLAKLKTILKRLGIADNTMHGLRHFFVSFCANNGVEPFKLIQWTGHSDLGTVLCYYSLSDAESRSAMRGVPFGTSDVDDGAPAAVAGQGQNEHNFGGQ